MAKNPVLQSARFVMARAKYVSISRVAIERLANTFASAKIKKSAMSWISKEYFTSQDPIRLLTYIFVLDTLNFCFWAGQGERWRFMHHGKPITGFFALSLALKDWFDKHPRESTFEYFASMPWDEFKRMLQGGDRLLFLRERWKFLRAVSSLLVKKYGGDPRKFIAEADSHASALALKIAKELPSFADKARYAGREIWFLKRAQILVVDIWKAFHGKGYGRFGDIKWITALADYKVPQILETFGAVVYSRVLEDRLRRKEFIGKGSPEEVEIRAATVLAAQYLYDALLRRKKEIPPFKLDCLLWDKSQTAAMRLPHHYTKTIYY